MLGIGHIKRIEVLYKMSFTKVKGASVQQRGFVANGLNCGLNSDKKIK